MDKREVRNINLEDLEVQKNETDCILRGYVNKYEKRSEYMGFYEEIRQGAFDKSLKGDNILALYGHDYNKPLGRMGANLTLRSDEVGLYFELRINPNVSWAKDTYELVKDGVLQGMSFGFSCNDDDWKTDNEGNSVRSIKDLSLYEISVVSSPAYLDSNVSCRSFEEYRNKLQTQKDLEIRKKKIAIELELL
jgi:HK97 family phage prohead protease